MLTLATVLARVFSQSATMVKQGPRPLVICGPSGSGKSTLLKKLFQEFPDTFGFSVSHTSRKPRNGEEDGVHYHFVTVEQIQADIEKGEFIETASYSGNMYGTSKKAVQKVQNQGKVCVLDIEVEGVKQIKNSDLNPLLVFITPPSIEELEKRLRGRNTETEESLAIRLATAKYEMEYGNQTENFHRIILNKKLKDAYNELQSFIVEELIKQYDEDFSQLMSSSSSALSTSSSPSSSSSSSSSFNVVKQFSANKESIE